MGIFENKYEYSAGFKVKQMLIQNLFVKRQILQKWSEKVVAVGEKSVKSIADAEILTRFFETFKSLTIIESSSSKIFVSDIWKNHKIL